MAGAQALPKAFVSIATPLGRVDEHTVVLALNFAEGVAEGIQKIRVGGDHFAVEVEFNGGLGLVDGRMDGLQFKQP